MAKRLDESRLKGHHPPFLERIPYAEYMIGGF